MAISDKITSIETHLEEDYNALETLGVSVENRNIENIKDMANQIYAKFPKTSFSEGTEVTLSNGLKGKIDFENDIVGYGDTEQETTNGYQLIHQANFGTFTDNGITFTQLDNGTIKVNGSTGSTGASMNLLTGTTSVSNNPNNISIEANQTYTLSGNPNGSENTVRLVIHTSSYGNVRSANGTKATFSETVDVSISAVRIIVQPNTTVTNFIVSPMLEKGSTAHDFEKYTGGIPSPNPSYPFQVKSVTGELEEVIEGKNKLKFKQAEETTTSGVTIKCNDNTTLTLNGTSNGQVAFGFNLEPIKLVGTYKASGYTRNDNFVDLYWKDKNGTIQYAHLKNNPTITFNEGDTLYQIFVYVVSGTTVTFNNETFKLQLEKGSTATSYEPYHTPISYPISLGSLEFNSIGNYTDELLTDRETKKWYKHSEIIKILLKSTDNWSGTLAGGVYRVNTNSYTNQIKALSSSDLSIKSTHFQASWDNVIGELVSGYIIVYSNKNIFITTQFNTSNMEGWKTFLDNNNVYVYCPLETPTDIEITDQTLINQLENWYNAQSFNGTTIITSNGNLPMPIKVRALKGE